MRATNSSMVLAMIGGLLGLLHIALTPLTYPRWTLEALWFLGSGLAILAAAAANYVASRAGGAGGQGILIAINLAMAGFFAAAWLVLPGPQVIVGGLLFLGLALCSAAALRTKAVTG